MKPTVLAVPVSDKGLDVSVGVSLSLDAPGAEKFVAPDALSNNDESWNESIIASLVSIPIRVFAVVLYFITALLCWPTLMKCPLWYTVPAETEAPTPSPQAPPRALVIVLAATINVPLLEFLKINDSLLANDFVVLFAPEFV